jgi:hypothetical protein
MASSVEIRGDIDPKKYFPNAKYIINYAFSIGKKHYFRFAEHLNIPYERGLSTLVFYREMEMNTDREYLQAHADAVNNILRQNPIDVFQIKLLNDQLQQRLQLPKDTELMYKLASVVFFDQEENPDVYEFEYGNKKIAFWKEAADLNDFFLRKPMGELIPYLRYVGRNLSTFSKMIESANKRHLANLSVHLSEKQKMKLNGRKSSSPAATPQN